MVLHLHKNLWSNSERARFFLVPDDRLLPAGDFELKTVTGRKQQVKEAAIVEFEISRDEAKAWLKEQFGELLSTAKQGITDAIKNWRSPTSENNSETSQSRTETALSELEELLHQSSEQLQEKSTHSVAHLKAIALALNGMLESAISAEPHSLEKSQDHAKKLREHLDALGIRTKVQLEEFPERLHNLYFASGQQQNFKKNAEELEAIANQIEQTSTIATQAIRHMAKQQLQFFNQIEVTH